MPETYMIHPTTLDRTCCRLQYHWSRQYKPIRTAPALEFGIAIHDALEKYYASNIDPVKAFNEYMDEHSITLSGYEDSDRKLGTAMLSNYISKYKGHERFKVISTEQEIARKVPIPDDDPHPPEWAKRFYVSARVDAIVFDQSLGRTFVLEHKTFSEFNPQLLQLNHQFVIEKFVADGWLRRQKKSPTEGVLYNGLRKSTGLRKSRDTNLFERHPLYITDEQVKVMLHRVYWTLMTYSSSFFPVYPEPATMTCKFCDFKQPCIAYQRGEDWKFYFDNLFVERKEDDEEDIWL